MYDDIPMPFRKGFEKINENEKKIDIVSAEKSECFEQANQKKECSTNILALVMLLLYITDEF